MMVRGARTGERGRMLFSIAVSQRADRVSGPTRRISEDAIAGGTGMESLIVRRRILTTTKASIVFGPVAWNGAATKASNIFGHAPTAWLSVLALRPFATKARIAGRSIATTTLLLLLVDRRDRTNMAVSFYTWRIAPTVRFG